MDFEMLNNNNTCQFYFGADGNIFFIEVGLTFLPCEF